MKRNKKESVERCYFVGVHIVPFREIMDERVRLEKLLPLHDFNKPYVCASIPESEQSDWHKEVMQRIRDLAAKGQCK